MRIIPLQPMPKLCAWPQTAHWVAAAALCAAHLACEAPGGASLIVDPLTQVATGMNRSGLRDLTWSYRHENAEPYWVVAAPAGTKESQLDTVDLPDAWRSAARDCVSADEAVVFLAEAKRCSCLRPILVPEIRELQSVRKSSGEETVFILHRDKGNPWLVTIE